MRCLICLLLIFSFTTHANNTCEVAGNQTAIFFANGMFNKKTDKLESIEAIQSTIEFLYEDGLLNITEEEYNELDYKLSENFSEFLPFQLFEVLKMRLDSENTNWHSKWRNSWNGRTAVPEPLIDQNTRYLIDEIEDPLADAMRLDIDGHYYDSDLREMVAEYLEALRSGYRVIIIAHSQGNMYANLAWKMIEAEEPELVKSVYIISVASPDGVLFGDYVTIPADVVIQGVEKFFPSTADPQFWIEDNFHDDINGLALRHGFVTEYMQLDGASSLIKDYLVYGFNNLPYPESNISLEPSVLPNGRTGCGITLFAEAESDIGEELEVKHSTVVIPYNSDSAHLNIQIDLGTIDSVDTVKFSGDVESITPALEQFTQEGFSVSIGDLTPGTHELIIHPVKQTEVDGAITDHPLKVNWNARFDENYQIGYLPSTSSIRGTSSSITLAKDLCERFDKINDMIDEATMTSHLSGRTVKIDYTIKFKGNLSQCITDVEESVALYTSQVDSTRVDLETKNFAINGDTVSFSFEYTVSDSAVYKSVLGWFHIKHQPYPGAFVQDTWIYEEFPLIRVDYSTQTVKPSSWSK